MALIRINHLPSRKDLRVFSALWFLVLGGGALYSWVPGSVVSPIVVGAAILIGIGGLFRPSQVRWIYLGAAYLTYPIGFVVSHVVLVALYFLVFTPYGLLLRLFGHDPLKRGFDSKRSSYWEPKTERRLPASYFRQH